MSDLAALAQHLAAQPWWPFAAPPAAALAVAASCLLLRRLALSRASRAAAESEAAWDNVAVSVVRGPSVVWCLIAGVYAGTAVSGLPPAVVAFAAKSLAVLWLVSATLVVMRLAEQLIRIYGRRVAATSPLTSLTKNLARGVILVLGGLVILNNLGISITPMLTALGVGGLAVALALQDTLANLFAGFYLTVARKVRVGDYVKLDSGEEGTVLDLVWRATLIETLAGNLVIVPNTKIAQANVTNFDLPARDLAVLVQVGVDYRSDLEIVEQATLEVAREVMQDVEGGVPQAEPTIRFHTFGESSVDFTAVLRTRTFKDQYLVKHEFVKRLHRRFAREGITIPFPQRTLTIEKAPQAAAAARARRIRRS